MNIAPAPCKTAAIAAFKVCSRRMIESTCGPIVHAIRYIFSQSCKFRAKSFDSKLTSAKVITVFSSLISNCWKRLAVVSAKPQQTPANIVTFFSIGFFFSAIVFLNNQYILLFPDNHFVKEENPVFRDKKKLPYSPQNKLFNFKCFFYFFENVSVRFVKYLHQKAEIFHYFCKKK